MWVGKKESRKHHKENAVKRQPKERNHIAPNDEGEERTRGMRCGGEGNDESRIRMCVREAYVAKCLCEVCM